MVKRVEVLQKREFPGKEQGQEDSWRAQGQAHEPVPEGITKVMSQYHERVILRYFIDLRS